MRRRGAIGPRSLLVMVLVGACAKASVEETPGAAGSGGSKPSGGGGAGGGFAVNPAGGGVDQPINPCSGPCSDFPAAPLIDEGTPPNAAQMFGGTASGAGPCLLEPEDGALYPNNWLRPRVRWTGTGLHQIRIESQRQDKPLVAYTTKSSWALPKEIWKALAAHVQEEDITISVRAAGGGVTTVRIRVASVKASGSMVFWAAKPTEVGKSPEAVGVENDSELLGFSVGDEGTTSVLKIPQIKQPSRNQGGQTRPARCIGCHVATPDGGFVAFTDHWPWNSVIAGVKPGVTGEPLPNMSAGGLSALNMPWGGMMTFSKHHWTPGKRLMVVTSSLSDPKQPWSTDNKKPARLLWYNLDAPEPPMVNGQRFPVDGQQFGVVRRDGDRRGAACPHFSADGSRVVYASTAGHQDGRLELGATDLYQVPFNGGEGGMATPVAGASDPAFEEYYPAFSPDDRFIAFNRVPAGQRMYANPNAELFIVHTRTGTSQRLKANDPPACSGKRSPGINNHWPKWSPQVQTSSGGTYYWIIFSSNRADIAPVKPTTGGALVNVSQLYITAVVERGERGYETYPAIYLWNQPTATLNTTPVWESLDIPRVIE